MSSTPIHDVPSIADSMRERIQLLTLVSGGHVPVVALEPAR